ncbi:hypothetical protein J4H86_07250 [Spiractinospora alimapuensis]|uniref:hypothetical protein n=1 Tax=Spiractinospora alimapuensis TaxID=2820884 RepID=UPI001F3C7429|nr:hypothetical protein [Spiractinospora alimapuensis]QVQ53532.1 hypothetical protein J4H86_07250 [Spiractinospora alimapuensis]
MIPNHWIRHLREEDLELVGYIIPTGDGRFVPATLFGYPLAEAGDRADAESVLDAAGLSYLADTWMLRNEDEEPFQVEIVESSPDRVVVRNVDFGREDDYGARIPLDVPTDQLSRR